MLTSLYGKVSVGSEGLTVEGRVHSWSSWWRGVIENSSREEGRWFWQRLEKRIGDRGNTSFWGDLWVGDQHLKLRFPRLFHLCRNQGGSVRDMGRWLDGKWVWDWE